MEMPSRRSNYTLLSQIPDDPLYQQPKYSASTSGAVTQQPYYYESHSGDKNKLKSERAGAGSASFDWDVIDQRMIQAQPQQARIGTSPFPASFGLQRQSSGSSFAESSISGDYYTADVLGGGSSSSKSWAQQTEESYQLQLALALRLSSEATCADGPNFLDPVHNESASLGSAEAISHRFWNYQKLPNPTDVSCELPFQINGCLSYSDKVPDGFYSIHGMDPYVWAVCSDLQESGRVPSLESLRTVDPANVSSVEVISVDRRGDPSLRELQNLIHNVSSSSITTEEVVDQLAKLVCNHLGGAASNGEDDLITIWKECSNSLKDCLGSVVLPIGSLSVGLCRHRSLLFKVLADFIGLPCRVAKGCKYCTREDACSCLVRFAVDREYFIDLIGKPGCLCEPDSLLNGPSTISISSPLRFPRLKQVEPTIDFRLLAKQYFSDFQSLNLIFDDSLAERNHEDRTGSPPGSSNPEKISDIVKDSTPLKLAPPVGHKDVNALLNLRGPTNRDTRFGKGGLLVPSTSAELGFDAEDLKIPWSDLVLKETIGAGSFGTVHRAEWNGCDVAVKILMEQDFHAEQFKEFLREVGGNHEKIAPSKYCAAYGCCYGAAKIVHCNRVFIKGSLYRLLHKPGANEVLDERRRLSMAYDVAKGMNYLHKHNPPIVHRDLKSPNLLVDRKYTVKVADFGLSRLKANTFLSSKSAAGTPEWMAPEVLRDEPSNEKSDVYSFGVILWELATLQQPWGSLNPAQVVAAVGFKGKRLEIPRDMNPQVAAIIEACWTNEPWKRPSFSSIMESLRPLIRSPPTTQPGRVSWEYCSDCKDSSDWYMTHHVGLVRTQVTGMPMYIVVPMNVRDYWWVVEALLLLACYGSVYCI
ncbi:UNVERIFIED_CONTAM: Serine/threonine-protein kinase CTR1 [Sesamum calycinum]|uniref:Serine/threonine-protein kinase CTR1 n=1 Tax=Sesamum calycinum TaxID=2727403 RepID=A0AAW2MZZ5_9LAMI